MMDKYLYTGTKTGLHKYVQLLCQLKIKLKTIINGNENF